jgi:hypothetical protein
VLSEVSAHLDTLEGDSHYIAGIIEDLAFKDDSNDPIDRLYFDGFNYANDQADQTEQFSLTSGEHLITQSFINDSGATNTYTVIVALGDFKTDYLDALFFT